VKRLGELARAAGDLLLELSGDAGTPVEDVSYDSAGVSPGDLFFCVKGYGVDGHDFAARAVEAGAVALCVERPTGAGVPEVLVSDSRRAAALIAADFFDHPGDDMVLIGVTGTNGKTTTTYLLESILEADGRKAGLIGTIGARIDGEDRATVGTTPEPIDLQRLLAEMRSRGLEHVALEVTSHGLALNRVDGLQFDSAVFTNLSCEHLGFHGGMAEYFAAKRALFEPDRSAQAAINVDDPYGRELMATVGVPAEGYGLSDEATIRAEHVRLGRRGSEFTLVTPVGELEISTALAGSFNVSNCLAAAASALQVGVDLAAVGEGIARVKKVPGRMEFVDAGQPFSVVVDYAHTPAALESVLGEGRRLAEADGGRLICLFGCGGGTDPGKRPLMGEIGARFADHLVLTSDNPRFEEPRAIMEEIAVGVGAASPTLLEERGEAIEVAMEVARPGDLVVIAGKGHETGQELVDRLVPFDDREVTRSVLGALGWNGRDAKS
jgi:UDP-N-acetylmuramoyl-L-alanyl-D-glutamate--2,6-diaminopimelate ligase